MIMRSMTSPRVRTPFHHRLGTKVLAALLAGSTLLGAAVVSPDVATAQEEAPSAEREQRLAERQQRIEERVAAAIESGKLTQEEADELRTRFEERRARAHDDRTERQANRQANRQERLDSLATTLGTTADELKAALKDGQSIADIAVANGVDVQSIIDEMVAQATARIDEAVANDRIDPDKATELKSRIEERITARVNGEHRSRG